MTASSSAIPDITAPTISNLKLKNDSKTLFCPVCSQKSSDIKKLKFHIVLEHSDLHMCLWCVEKKGWSDEFSSQEAYNSHYESQHKGIIQERAQKRRTAKAEQLEERKQQREARRQAWRERKSLAPLIKRKRHHNSCKYCPEFPVFTRGLDLDRHLISAHNHDFCKICHLIGPAMKIRVHIVLNHPENLCHLCGASSPIFPNGSKVCLHLQQCHSTSSFCAKYFCTNCSNLAFVDVAGFVAHTESVHPAEGEIRAMKSKVGKGLFDDGKVELVAMKNVFCGLRNDSGQDCFLISVLHLLCQTSLPDLLPKLSEHEHCQNCSCLLANFFNKYREERLRFFPHEIVENYAQFGVRDLPVQVGDFIRFCLTSLTGEHVHHSVSEAVTASFRTALLWKFSCKNCQRFSVVKSREFVIKVNGFNEAPFEELVNKFLNVQTCRCGNKIDDVDPIVEEVPEYLFVEVDRSAKIDSGVHELVLYTLQLKHDYHLLGHNFVLFATINYNLDYIDGGHYSTLILNQEGFTSIHESEIRVNANDPKFDTETVVVVLRKVINGNIDANETVLETTPVYSNFKNTGHSYAEEIKVEAQNLQSIVQPAQNTEMSSEENLDILNAIPKDISHLIQENISVLNSSDIPTAFPADSANFENHDSLNFSSIKQSGSMKCSNQCSSTSNVSTLPSASVCCDNFGLLSNDQSIIKKYRDEYDKRFEEMISEETSGGGVEDVSLRALGDQVLQSKIYRIKRLKQKMKDLPTINYISSGLNSQTIDITDEDTGGPVIACSDVDFGQI